MQWLCQVKHYLEVSWFDYLVTYYCYWLCKLVTNLNIFTSAEGRKSINLFFCCVNCLPTLDGGRPIDGPPLQRPSLYGLRWFCTLSLSDDDDEITHHCAYKPRPHSTQHIACGIFGMSRYNALNSLGSVQACASTSATWHCNAFLERYRRSFTL